MLQEVFDKLRTLQEILSKKYEVEQEIEDIPTALATKTELLKRLKQTYIRKNDDFAKTKERIKSARIKMLDAEAEREKYEKQMDIIKTQREYEALDKEIKDATIREQDLRLELQNLEKVLEEMQANIEKEEVMIQKQEEELKAEQSRIKHEVREKNKVLQKMEKEEEKITPGIDEEILFKFERIIRSKSGLGIVPVVDGVCTGCHIIQTPKFVNDLRLGEEIMFCPDCSRILFFQDEEEPDGGLNIFQTEISEEANDESETDVNNEDESTDNSNEESDEES
jgi:predicted  nucleic acid-binding Zn-ribbon protein